MKEKDKKEAKLYKIKKLLNKRVLKIKIIRYLIK